MKLGPGALVVKFGRTSVSVVERGQDRERGARALELEALLVMPHAAPQQAQADDAVADDHDGREHRVARAAPPSPGRRRA